jgi:5-methylcytosine-specific restriction endonuclease McrA
MLRANEFTEATKRLALARQHFKCGSCGTPIHGLGNVARSKHKFGEGAQAHHIKPVKMGGLATVANCIIICQSCHYSVHEGGNYRHGTVAGTPADYPHYKG